MTKEIGIMEAELELMEAQETGDGDAARAVLDRMREEGIPRRRDAWLSALNAYSKAGRWQEAKALLREMGANGMKPSYSEYHALMEACDVAGEADEAKRALDELKEVAEPNLISYLKVLTTLARMPSQQHKQEAEALYDEARSLGILQPWTGTNGRANRNSILDISDYSTDVGEIMVRVACRDRATLEWAGKGGFEVQVGPMNPELKREKLRRAAQVMTEEFGLKIRKDPMRIGRIHVGKMEMKRLAQEMILEGKVEQPTPFEKRRIGSATGYYADAARITEARYRDRERGGPVSDGRQFAPL